MNSDLSSRLAHNVKTLRQLRGKTQHQMSKLAQVPRATWAHLESGGANPTLAVLHAAAVALGVSLEELLAAPRGSARVYRREQIRVQRRGQVSVQKLLPDPLPGVEID